MPDTLKPCPVCRSKMKIFTSDDDKSGKLALFYGAAVCTKCDSVLPAWMAEAGIVSTRMTILSKRGRRDDQDVL